MNRNTIRLWISLIILLSLVALPVVVYGQETVVDPDPEVEVEVEPGEPGEGAEMEGGEGEGAEMEGGEGEGAEMESGEGEGAEMESGKGEGAEMESGEGEGAEGEAPEYLPTTGGSTQTTPSMVVLAVLGLLFSGAFVGRALQFQRGR